MFMELQGHILIPESYIASLISTCVQCKITVTVVVIHPYKINFCLMEKLYFVSI